MAYLTLTRLMRACVLLFLLFYSVDSFSQCLASGYASAQISNLTLTVARDLPVGSLITSVKVEYAGTAGFNCTNNGYYYYENDTGPSSSIADVYESSVPGIGIKMESVANTAYTNPAKKLGPLNGYSNMSSASSTVSFYKTGNITPGSFTAGKIARAFGEDGVSATEVFMGSNNIITQISCSLSTPKLAYFMGSIDMSTFQGAGSSPDIPLKEHNLSMDCDKDANVNMTLMATQNPDSSDDSVIQLTGQGDAGVAQGVGVQLMYDSKPIEMNKTINLKTSTGGVENFNIGARYIQTKGTITPGKANATAVLNITYQ